MPILIMMVIVIMLIMMMMVIMMVIIMVMILVVMAVMMMIMMMIKTMVVDPPICLLQLSSFFRFVLPPIFFRFCCFSLFSFFSSVPSPDFVVCHCPCQGGVTTFPKYDVGRWRLEVLVGIQAEDKTTQLFLLFLQTPLFLQLQTVELGGKSTANADRSGRPSFDRRSSFCRKYNFPPPAFPPLPPLPILATI